MTRQTKRRRRTKRVKSTTKVSEMMPRSRALYNFLKDDWSEFKKVCNRRWSKFSRTLLQGSFSGSRILGSGYFGLVLSTEEKKLVVKITSDQEEGYFTKLILTDNELRFSKGLPLILDNFHIPEWGAFVILRENVKFGVDKLPKSSPLSRTLPILDEFGEKVVRIEQKVTQVLNSLQGLNRKKIQKEDFDYAYREARGLVRGQIIKSLKRIPSPNSSSKYHEAMFVIRHTLDKYGIALWDLHSLNLGRHQFDMQEFCEDYPPLDKSCILILDVGGSFGSPIMTEAIDALEV